MIVALCYLALGLIAVATFVLCIAVALANATRPRRAEPNPDWPVSNVHVTEKGRGGR